MLINAQEDFSFLKSIFVEPFKGGGGSSRRNSDPTLPIFIFFVALYFLAFMFSSTRK
jgi:hypothetical protein